MQKSTTPYSTTTDDTIITKNADGFTLLEISLVLVIIGLIVGGIMIGKSLIEAYTIRAQISQIESIRTAANSFKIKYGYLPGDIPPNQTAQLGLFTFTGTYAGKTYYNNLGGIYGYWLYGYGDGNERINDGEVYVFWQHLSETKMIAGQYGKVNGINDLNANTATYTTAGIPMTVPINLENFFPISKLYHTYRFLLIGANIKSTIN